MEMRVFIIPILMIILGGLCFAVSGKINGVIGLRTPKSMESNENWTYANKFAGKMFLVMGVLGFIYIFKKANSGMSADEIMDMLVLMEIVGAVLVLIIAEIKLRIKFKKSV